MVTIIPFVLLLNGLIPQSFAMSCEERYRTSFAQTKAEHLPLNKKLPRALPNFPFSEETGFDKPNVRKLSNPLMPHAHKMEMGQKYHGSTSETFRLESLKKRNKFHEFFQNNYPSIKLSQTEMDFWSHLRINNFKNFQTAMVAAKALAASGYPLMGFIYIVHPDMTLSIAPRTIKEGKDTGDAKHIALANGDSILASGELEVKSIPTESLIYNLKSGTYMASLNAPEQLDICIEMKHYFSELTKLPIEFSEAF